MYLGNKEKVLLCCFSYTHYHLLLCSTRITQCMEVIIKVSNFGAKNKWCHFDHFFGILLGHFPTLCDTFFLVMGPRKSSYLKIAPKGSFIHTDNFPQGAKALAKYLVELDEVK